MVCRFQQKTMHCGRKMFVINVAEHSGLKKELHSFPYHTKQGLAKTSGKRRLFDGILGVIIAIG